MEYFLLKISSIRLFLRKSILTHSILLISFLVLISNSSVSLIPDTINNLTYFSNLESWMLGSVFRYYQFNIDELSDLINLGYLVQNGIELGHYML